MPPKFRYDLSGQWYRGNVHMHTNISDGGRSPLEATQAYADAGYDFVCLTDHVVASDAAAMDVEWPLTVLDGVEIHGSDHAGTPYHAVCLGRFEDVPVERGFVPMLEYCREQGGLLILAHPFLMYHTPDNARQHGFHGVEVYNFLGEPRCRANSVYHWDMMLEQNRGTLAFAVDDTHGGTYRPKRKGSKRWKVKPGGWIVVNAPECTPDALMAAMRAGNFYSSTGPEIHSLKVSRGKVRLKCSPARRAWLCGPYWSGQCEGLWEDKVFTEATFDVVPEWNYARIEVEDESGRRAWTNTLFIDDEA